MSLPCRTRIAALLLIAAVAGCSREQRHATGTPGLPATPIGGSSDTIFPGNAAPPPLDARAAAYERNAAAIAKGQQLFSQMNCVGCHSHGGGGMGPPLMDDQWRYGGRIDQIASTIAEGRPNGMPAWRRKLTQDQIWALAAYVRSLSGLPSKDAVSSRSESMSGPTPGSLTPHQDVHNSDIAQP